MNEPDCVPDDIVEIPQVHCLARLIEPERKRDGQAGAACRDLLVRTLHVLEMMREDIDQFEFKRYAWRTEPRLPWKSSKVGSTMISRYRASVFIPGFYS
jgi:hypothetical protein